MFKTAVISKDGVYRWRLTREWGNGPHVTFLMMNPSTADAAVDDATIRKCIGFAKRWGRDGIDVVNLSAYRSRDPKALHGIQDLWGNEYWAHLLNALDDSDLLVCAWGCETEFKKLLEPFAEELLQKIRTWYPRRPIKCLGRTKGGTPRHPLMLPYTTPLEPM